MHTASASASAAPRRLLSVLREHGFELGEHIPVHVALSSALDSKRLQGALEILLQLADGSNETADVGIQVLQEIGSFLSLLDDTREVEKDVIERLVDCLCDNLSHNVPPSSCTLDLGDQRWKIILVLLIAVGSCANAHIPKCNRRRPLKSTVHATVCNRIKKHSSSAFRTLFIISRIAFSEPETVGSRSSGSGESEAATPSRALRSRFSLRPGAVRSRTDGTPQSSATLDDAKIAILQCLRCFFTLSPQVFISQWPLYLQSSTSLAPLLMQHFQVHRISAYDNIPLVRKIFSQTGWALCESPPVKEANPTNKLARGHVRVSAPLLRGLFDNSSSVRAQSAQTISSLLQSSSLRQWFEKSRVSRRSNSSHGSFITDRLIPCLVDLLHCLSLALSFETHVDTLNHMFKCICVFAQELPIMRAQITQCAKEMVIMPASAPGVGRRVRPAGVECKSSETPQTSDNASKTRVRKFWSSANTDPYSLCVCERLIEFIIHLALNMIEQSPTSLPLMVSRPCSQALEMLNDLILCCKSTSTSIYVLDTPTASRTSGSSMPAILYVSVLSRFSNNTSFIECLLNICDNPSLTSRPVGPNPTRVRYPQPMVAQARKLLLTLARWCICTVMSYWPCLRNYILKWGSSTDVHTRQTSIQVLADSLCARMKICQEHDTDSDCTDWAVNDTTDVYHLLLGWTLPEMLLNEMLGALEDSEHLVRLSAFECFAQLTSPDWTRISASYTCRTSDRCVFKLLRAGVTDKIGTVRATACKAVGHVFSVAVSARGDTCQPVISHPFACCHTQQSEDVPIVDDILRACVDSKLAVRIQGLWALGNMAQFVTALADGVVSVRMSELKWREMCMISLGALEDSDKCLGNCVRVLGILGCGLTAFRQGAGLQDQIAVALIERINHTQQQNVYIQPKVHLNVCVSMARIIRQPAVLKRCLSESVWLGRLVEVLCDLLRVSNTNPKVCKYACAALSLCTATAGALDLFCQQVLEAVCARIHLCVFQAVGEEELNVGSPSEIVPPAHPELNLYLSKLLRRLVAHIVQRSTVDSQRLVLNVCSSSTVRWMRAVLQRPELSKHVPHETTTNIREAASMMAIYLAPAAEETNVLRTAMYVDPELTHHLKSIGEEPGHETVCSTIYGNEDEI